MCSIVVEFTLRGLPYMTSAVGGWRGPQKADERNEVEWIMYVTRGEGVEKSEHFADVIYESPPTLTHLSFHSLTLFNEIKRFNLSDPQGHFQIYMWSGKGTFETTSFRHRVSPPNLKGHFNIHHSVSRWGNFIVLFLGFSLNIIALNRLRPLPRFNTMI